MSTELVSFDELVYPLTKGQRDYIYLRLMGVEKSEAVKILKRKDDTHGAWLAEPKFREAEEFIVSHRGIYAKEAFERFIQDMPLKAQMVLSNLVNMGLNWEELKREDKPYVMRAVELTRTQHPSGGSYKELLLRIREEA